MIFRTATLNDIPQIQIVRNSVKENTLSDPALVSDKDCEEFMTERGKGWVCEIDNRIVGFAIADLKEHNIWALFIHPDFEKQGIGKRLHQIMLNWYFAQTTETVWLGTAPGTRGEAFYTKAGWAPAGMHGTKEVKFEMTNDNWRKLNSKHPLSTMSLQVFTIAAITIYLIFKLIYLSDLGIVLPLFITTTGSFLLLPLSIITYLSLIPILLFFGEKKWHIVILLIHIISSFAIMRGLQALNIINFTSPTSLSYIWAVGLWNATIGITLGISFFFVKNRGISFLFKCLGVVIIITFLTLLVIPVLVSSSFINLPSFFDNLALIYQLIHLLPHIVILLINIKTRRIKQQRDTNMAIA